MAKRLPPLVEVEWYDTTSDPNWQSRDKVLSESLTICFTVGYLIDNSDYAVVLAHTVNGDDSDYTKIPAGCVKRIRRVKRDGEHTAKQRGATGEERGRDVLS